MKYEHYKLRDKIEVLKYELERGIVNSKDLIYLLEQLEQSVILERVRLENQLIVVKPKSDPVLDLQSYEIRLGTYLPRIVQGVEEPHPNHILSEMKKQFLNGLGEKLGWLE